MSSSSPLPAWGRLPGPPPAGVWRPASRFEPPPPGPHGTRAIAHGVGRSYGDAGQNAGGLLWHGRGLDRWLAFDPATGVLDCEAGVTLAEIIDLALPQGWFLPATPGTRFVTVGGAIANDVHGKNHHASGTFGHHVEGFALWRSDRGEVWCSPTENADLFGATIGGLGLTGFVRRARLRLRRVAGPLVTGENIRFGNLDEFFALSAESDRDWEYTVAWVDCLAGGNSLGRGHFTRGNHAAAQPGPAAPTGTLSFPFVPPGSLVNTVSLRAFNALYYHRQPARVKPLLVRWEPFFYPLDGIRHWNRMYGPKGFYQYQNALPPETSADAVTEALAAIRASGQGSFLAVLKVFGDRPSPGWLSFPRPGATLALDFPNRGSDTLKLLDRLDAITLAAGGRVYPAKDARMSEASFKRYYPRWADLAAIADPLCSSSLARRVGLVPAV